MRRLQVDGLLHHDERVLVDVLMAMVLVDLELQAGEFGQDVRREPGLDEHREAEARARTEQELGELVADPLRRDDLQACSHVAHGGEHLGCDREAELRDEACRAHHAQWIVAEGLLRRDGRAQHAIREIAHAVVEVDELQAG